MYWSFIEHKTKDDDDFAKFIQLTVYNKTGGKVIIRYIDEILSEKSYKNCFIYENYEINIRRIDNDKFKFFVYELFEHDTIPDIKFGCELETCLNLTCNSQENIINLGHDKNWYSFLLSYIVSNIIPNLSRKFLKKFKKLYIALKPKSGYSDYTINLLTGESVEEKLPIFHDSIVFTKDSSLICADTASKFYKNELKGIDIIPNTLHCEIITPILYNIEDLTLLYENIIKPGCIHGNSSTAFHINVSFDSKNPVYFTDGFMYTFLNGFVNFEGEYYRVRENKEESYYAIKIFKSLIKYNVDYYRRMIYPVGKREWNYKKFVEEGHYKSYIELTDKYNSVYLKTPELMEFRLFSSEDEISKLILYVKNTKKLLLDSLLDFYTNQNSLIKSFQKLNVNTAIKYSELDYYNDFLYYKDGNFNVFKKWDGDLEELELALEELFKRRRQTFENIREEIHNKKYIIYTKYKNKKVKYGLAIYSDKKVLIDLITDV